jgi:lysophospholipase L1-like esterase
VLGELRNSDLKIAGFGACMISGYPHKSGGLFEVACAAVEKRLSRPVTSTVVSLDGFTAPRAEKYLSRKVLLPIRPDYVVIQFGSTDAVCPVRRVHRPSSSSRGLSSPKTNIANHCKSSGLGSSLRWEVASLLGYLLKAPPVTALPEYIAAIERMVKTCIADTVKPVVLSPFVYGSRYSTKSAIAFTVALQNLAMAHKMILVDCPNELGALLKTSVLLSDGFHLTPLGHRVIGEAIAEAIAVDARVNNRSG